MLSEMVRIFEAAMYIYYYVFIFIFLFFLATALVTNFCLAYVQSTLGE